ncbi:MAG: hypothetical protein HY650_12910 [Acidobacteria bacterium]|nr:hypothetical protein [Acidobacteriota bacterium]
MSINMNHVNGGTNDLRLGVYFESDKTLDVFNWINRLSANSLSILLKEPVNRFDVSGIKKKHRLEAFRASLDFHGTANRLTRAGGLGSG